MLPLLPGALPAPAVGPRAVASSQTILSRRLKATLKRSQGGWLICPGWDGGGLCPRACPCGLSGPAEVTGGGVGEVTEEWESFVLFFLHLPASSEFYFSSFSPSLGLAHCGLQVCQAPGMSGLSLGIIESSCLFLIEPPKSKSHD